MKLVIHWEPARGLLTITVRLSPSAAQDRLTAKPRPDSHRLADDSFAGYTIDLLGGLPVDLLPQLLLIAALVGTRISCDVRATGFLYISLKPISDLFELGS